MTALNKQALRKLAKALCGKEWVAFVHRASGTYAVGSLGHERGEDIIKWPGLDGQDNAENKAKFIAAANPSTVLSLLDELEAAEKRIAELEGGAFNPAILDVVAERQRQKTIEGWTPEHDDEHCNGELAMAAVCYINETGTVNRNGGKPWGWPWDASWWKPKTRRRNLVKAGALILAEIERLDRAAGIGVKGE